MDKTGQEGARAFYLQGYNGNQPYTFDRIGRGRIHIPRVCIALLGGIQPGKLQEYIRGAVSGGSADDGLLQRFGLAVYPDTGKDFIFIDRYPDIEAKDKSVEAFNIGMNCGEASGQTVFHCHVHLIPRRKGDVENPRGGVRHVIASKGFYEDKR